MSDRSEWHELIDRHLRGELNESEMERLAELLDSDPAARQELVDQVQWDTQLTEALRENRAEAELTAEAILGRLGPVQPNGALSVGDPQSRAGTVTRLLLAVAVGIIAVMGASLYLQRNTAERPIAKITGLGGALQWTGNEGRVYRDLEMGEELSGGTIEGMTPGTWFKLEFKDGSTVTISGNAVLTFSDDGQKQLHLKEGTFAANVKPQPADKPMLVYTRSALLEVVGTQFEVEAGLSETLLTVSVGSVRVQRLSDGNTVEVHAKQRLFAAADRELTPIRLPDSVSQWKSQLQLGPHATLGRWSPGSDDLPAGLAAVPFTTPQGFTVFAAAVSVSHGDNPPVVLQRDSRLRVRGKLANACKVFFGATIRHRNGEFAGNFQTIRPADEFTDGDEFEIEIDVSSFQLDPSLATLKNKLPNEPYGFVVESFWVHSLQKPAGLGIFEFELLVAEQN